MSQLRIINYTNKIHRTIQTSELKNGMLEVCTYVCTHLNFVGCISHGGLHRLIHYSKFFIKSEFQHSATLFCCLTLPSNFLWPSTYVDNVIALTPQKRIFSFHHDATKSRAETHGDRVFTFYLEFIYDRSVLNVHGIHLFSYLCPFAIILRIGNQIILFCFENFFFSANSVIKWLFRPKTSCYSFSFGLWQSF